MKVKKLKFDDYIVEAKTIETASNGKSIDEVPIFKTKT